MWQEERTTTWCVCACDNKISRVFSAVRSLGHCLSLSAVRLAIACFFIFLQSAWPQPAKAQEKGFHTQKTACPVVLGLLEY